MSRLLNVVKRVVFTSTIIGGGACSLILYNVGTSSWSDSHTWSSATRHYLTNKFMVVLGFISFRDLVKNSRNVRETQENLLMDNLVKNTATLYGKEFGFEKMNSVAEFRKQHPLTRYSHYQPYVEKIQNGDLLALTADIPLQLAVTSGTSGKSSLLPTTNFIFTRFFLSGIALLFQRLQETHPEWVTLQKSMKLFYTPRWKYTETGLRIGPNSSNPDSAQRIYHLYSTPPPAYRILTEPEALYIHLLFGLLDQNLGNIEANFASTVYTGFRTLESRWEELVQDIQTGTINSNLNIPSDIREQLEAVMKPNPERAEELRKEFTAGFENIAKRIWPNLNLIMCTTTGTMKMYTSSLKSKYCRDTQTYSPIYGASEGLLGVNLYPDSTQSLYCLIPSAQFFEFIRQEDSDTDNPDTLLLHQLEKGQAYEVVVTNGSGLYRYRMGDVVQGQMLNVHGEKISEEVFFTTLKKCEKTWNIRLRDYTTAESVLSESSALPHYLLFIEPESECCDLNLDLPDTTLRSDHPVYESFRAKGSIDKIQVIQVKRGSFQALQEMMLATSMASSNQFKVPRVLRKEEHVKYLLENSI
ncbi:4-substituted benzoates-glutamate ligase GH3.12 isoform X2 [Eurytemora carolleeae]|uniref:4-substituted benzoates-glutamate ligase GH3.12 isoform X2 n=1 Tax=Eurytemora carolleeae TaxID=1294199 RepID=UPI000C783354|nr:4-substituted benzoates-glutamate ligase GH3.12 isoform X2 [Eurytemora carolleeae]|eukprot:XP_023327761.1 4-substituted benzoates-glutamate ligase GH3.12-like isoform X2 [Eurytemora affinis]